MRWLGALLLLLPLPAAAEQVVLRSGEHPGFSRLVVPLAAPSGWRFGRTATGYRLALDRPGVSFDPSRVYDLIPRQRIAAIAAPATGGVLDLTVSCACHAEVFDYGQNKLVIDIRSGPAPANSPFETPFAATATAGPAPETMGTETDAKGPATATAPETAPIAAPVLPPMAVYDWRDNRPRMAEGDATAEHAAESGEPAGTTDHAAAVQPAPAQTLAAADPHGASQPEASQHEASQHEADPHGAAAETALAAAAPAATDHASAGHTTTDHATTDHAAAEPAAKTAPPTSDLERHLGGAEAKLAEAIGRAATSGLLTANREVPTLAPAGATAPTPKPAEPKPEPPPPVPEGPRMSMKTSLDPRLAPAPPPMTPEGGTCLPDRFFDLSTWAKDAPMAGQIEPLRTKLVGEFDRPDPAAVAALMRLYIYFGFGAEAEALPKSFGVSPGDGDLLAAMAQIMDDGKARTPGRLAGQAGCDGAVALWSVLAAPTIGPQQTVDEAAVVRSFSALPAALRLRLGPVLAERLLASGRIESARAVRDAVTRAAGPVGQGVEMMNARLDLAQGREAAAEKTIHSVAESAGPKAPEALILLVDTAVAKGSPVAAEDLGRIEALAHEFRGAPLGQRLARAHMLGLAVDGGFDAAFDEWAVLRGATPAATQSAAGHGETGHRDTGHDAAGNSDAGHGDTGHGDTGHGDAGHDGAAGNPAAATPPGGDPTGGTELWRLLAERGGDEALLRHGIDPAKAGTVSRPVAERIAQRLLGLGFPDPALAWLGRVAGGGPPAALLKAQARLALGDPAAALADLATLHGPEADRLRAAALAARGEHGPAAVAYGALGARQEEGAQAWRAGDWSLVERAGTETQKAVLSLIDPATGAPRQEPGAPGSAAPAEAGTDHAPDPASANPPDQPAVAQGGAAETPAVPAAGADHLANSAPAAAAAGGLGGPLAQGRALVDESERLRQALSALLTADSVPPANKP